jgi:hypothetical protein
MIRLSFRAYLSLETNAAREGPNLQEVTPKALAFTPMAPTNGRAYLQKRRWRKTHDLGETESTWTMQGSLVWSA